MKPLWEEHRKAKFFPFGASDKEAETNLSVIEGNDGTSYIDETRENAPAYRRKSQTKSITIKIIPLKSIFKEEGIAHIDYMSIDVEGHELKVLNGIDFNKISISVLTIENMTATAYGDDSIRNLMLKNNYIFWGRIGRIDDIYVHKDFLKS
jgi:FkbM family methyltransferase